MDDVKIIGFVGLGLIGGSIAKDLKRKNPKSKMIGYDQNPRHISEALELDIIDEYVVEINELSICDVIWIATPVDTIFNILSKLLDNIQKNSFIVDTGSTKLEICKQISSHPNRSHYIAAHPIAGTENSGPQAAQNQLFQNKINIICESSRSKPEFLQNAMNFFNDLEMKTLFMTPDEHDKHVAYVSHLSHVSSFMLGLTVLDIEQDEKNIFNLAGSGFASTVRLAKSSPEMWIPIFFQNKNYLQNAINEYIKHLQQFLQYLESSDVISLSALLQEANRIRPVLEGIDTKKLSTLETTPL